MSDAFDGAGEDFHGARFRPLLMVLAAVIIAVSLVWLGYSWALNEMDRRGVEQPTIGQDQNVLEP